MLNQLSWNFEHAKVYNYSLCHDLKVMPNASSLFALDIDECSTLTHNCLPIANCTNTDGSYLCICDSVHNGSGSSCKGKIRPFQGAFD